MDIGFRNTVFAMLSHVQNPKLKIMVLQFLKQSMSTSEYSSVILKPILPHSFNLLRSHSVCDATVGRLYQLQASSVITDVIGKENEHAEFIFHIWQLNDSEFHGGFMKYEKFIFQKHHVYWCSLGLEKIET